MGGASGGLVAIDVDTPKGHDLQWARILVSSNGRRVPRILHVMIGASVFVVQLW